MHSTIKYGGGVVTKPRPIPPVPIPVPFPMPVPVPVPRPRQWPPRKTLVLTKDSSSFVANVATDMLDASTYIVGKGIILFTMFYCSMNWWFYKRMREDIEKKNKKDENEDEKK